MKKLLFTAVLCLSVSVFAQQPPENLARDFVNGLSGQKDFSGMDIFFTEDDFNTFIAELKTNHQVSKEIKKSLEDPKEIENSRKEFRKDKSRLQQKWEKALEIINKENLSVTFEKIETEIENQDGMIIHRINIFFKLKKGDSVFDKYAKVEGIIVGGRLKIAVVKSFDIQLDKPE